MSLPYDNTLLYHLTWIQLTVTCYCKYCIFVMRYREENISTGRLRHNMPRPLQVDFDLKVPYKKIIKQKQVMIITTFILHIKLHSELQQRRNALNVL